MSLHFLLISKTRNILQLYWFSNTNEWEADDPELQFVSHLRLEIKSDGTHFTVNQVLLSSIVQTEWIRDLWHCFSDRIWLLVERGWIVICI